MKPDHIPPRIKAKMDELTLAWNSTQEAVENGNLSPHFAAAGFAAIGQLRVALCEEWDALVREA